MEAEFKELKKILKHRSKSELILILFKEMQLKSFYKNHLDLLNKESESKEDIKEIKE